MQPSLMESAVTPRVSPVPFVPISGSFLTTSMMLELELPAVVDEPFEEPELFLLLLPHALATNPITKSTASARMSLVFISPLGVLDRKSTRLNSSHLVISYAVFCLQKKRIAT